MANDYTKLFVDNEEIELYADKELPLNVNKQVNDLDGNVQGDYSRVSITVPATKSNVSILGNSRAFKPFRIEVNGQPDINGKAQVRRIPLTTHSYGSINYQYEINLVSKNSNWLIDLGNTYLSELTTEVVTWNGANVAAGFLSEPNVRNWAFTLVKFKEWANSTGSGSTLQYLPSVTETTPALYIAPLIRAAFNSVGYTVISEFLETDLGSKLVILTPLFDKLPLPFNNEYLNTVVSLSAPSAIAPNVGASDGFPFDQIDQAAPSNPTAYDNITNFEYTAPLTGYYEVNLEMTFGTTPPVAPYFFITILQLNGVNVSPSVGFAFDNTGASSPYPTNGELFRSSGLVFAQQGDIIKYSYSCNVNIDVETAVCTFNGEAVREFGMDIDFKYLLGQYKFLPFLSGLKTMFNLTFEPDDEARTITIEPKDNYIDSNRATGIAILKEGFYKNEQKDYTQLIDRSKLQREEYPTIAETYAYNYSSDSDDTIQWVEGQNDLKIYEGRYTMGDGAEPNQVKSITVPFFAKTIHVSDFQAAHPESEVKPQFMLIYPQNYVLDPTATEGDYEITPRIAYHAGQRFGDLEGVDGYIEMFEIQGIKTRVPATFMVNYNDNTGLDPNLGFNTQIINGVQSKGLIQNYYLNELVRLDRGNTYEAYSQFNSIDKANFTFRLRAYIDGKRYIVQQLQGYNPTKDNPVFFKFFLEVNPTLVDVNHIQNSGLNPVVSLLTS